MLEDTVDSNRRKVLAAIAAVGAGSAAATAGTFAAFSDTATSSDSLSTHSIVMSTSISTPNTDPAVKRFSIVRSEASWPIKIEA
ncbi:MAG: SipW-dependent-type signal peptide-containing protein [Haloarculaceae archaeon]